MNITELSCKGPGAKMTKENVIIPDPVKSSNNMFHTLHQREGVWTITNFQMTTFQIIFLVHPDKALQS